MKATMTNLPILIFECANAHGGDYDLLKSTIEEFQKVIYPKKHIKFQAFHPDTIALPDFNGYPIYQDLLLPHEKWTELVQLAAKGFDGIWLDIFDLYGVEVFSENKENIYGIKLQASVLENDEVVSALRKNNLLDGSVLMLNVSGFKINEIENFLDIFKELNMKEIILQIGHQAYPTALKDTGIQKVATFKKHFPEFKICIADHSQAEDDFSCIVPLLGIAAGCELVEKHICLNRKLSKYDGFSSLEFKEMQLLSNRIQSSWDILNGDFISDSESEYLTKSVQIPVAKSFLPKGSLIAKSNLIFRRTAQIGDSFSKIAQIQMQSFILNENINEKNTISEHQFTPANIGVIVACRMKSSRLKSKAILPIEGIASIERCLLNCLEIKEASHVILATSTEQEDKVLENYTLNGKVKFWQGDPDDVMKRYLDVCDKYNINVVIRVTGDCPVISPEIASFLLKKHFASGADYTAAKNSAVGTACEVYNVEVLKRVLKYVGKASHSEYMTWYLQNNQDFFKVEIVDLPKTLLRNYRLTLDYPEDMKLFEMLFKELNRLKKEPNLINIFEILDSNPEMVKINSNLTLMYKTDQELIDKLNKETRISKVKVY